MIPFLNKLLPSLLLALLLSACAHSPPSQQTEPLSYTAYSLECDHPHKPALEYYCQDYGVQGLIGYLVFRTVLEVFVHALIYR